MPSVASVLHADGFQLLKIEFVVLGCGDMEELARGNVLAGEPVGEGGGAKAVSLET